MIKLYFILIIISNSLVFAQKYIINYSQKYDSGNPANHTLTIADSVSWYKYIPEAGKKVKDKLFIKKYAQKFLYYKANAPGLAFYIKDTLHPMIWKLTNQNKIILGYTCNSATTSFRGRNYTAYYARSIAVADGPWKFGGLPGLILEISSDEGFIKFVALGLNQISTITEIHASTNDHKFINWQTFKERYKKAYDNDIQMSKTSENNIKYNIHGSLKVESIESIYKELEEGDGLAY